MIDQEKLIEHKSLSMCDEPKSLVLFEAGVLNRITNKKSRD
jgi:hypothetical protein